MGEKSVIEPDAAMLAYLVYSKEEEVYRGKLSNINSYVLEQIRHNCVARDTERKVFEQRGEGFHGSLQQPIGVKLVWAVHVFKDVSILADSTIIL